MAISESELERWTGLGAVKGSADTYASIKKALNGHSWPKPMQYDVYLQGSYANSTNIRGDSDVDVVVEFTSVAYSNLTQEEKASLHIGAGAYAYKDCLVEVTKALKKYYGEKQVDTSGGKAIKVLAQPGRLKADVLPCVKYKRYESMKVIAEGITFWNQRDNQQVINYPKLHIDNGVAKNRKERTNEWYKPAVRMFKNARNAIIGNSDELRKAFPSYFVECLLYNAMDGTFGKTWQDTYAQVVNYLNGAFLDKTVSKFTTQNGQTYLFGLASVQWSAQNASNFTQRLVKLWNDWKS